MIPTGQPVVDDLRAHGPSQAWEIATRLGRSVASVANTLSWLRGYGWVTDGSAAERTADGIAGTPAPSPITWAYLATREQAPLNRVFHGEAVEPLR